MSQAHVRRWIDDLLPSSPATDPSGSLGALVLRRPSRAGRWRLAAGGCAFGVAVAGKKLSRRYMRREAIPVRVSLAIKRRPHDRVARAPERAQRNCSWHRLDGA
jgi:hypothetical protein